MQQAVQLQVKVIHVNYKFHIECILRENGRENTECTKE